MLVEASIDITVIWGNITSMWFIEVNLNITKSVKLALCFVVAKFSCIKIQPFMQTSTVAYRLSEKVPAAGSEFCLPLALMRLQNSR